MTDDPGAEGESDGNRRSAELIEEARENFKTWLHQSPFDGKPFRDFVPPGAMAWLGTMIEDPSRSWPWPYTNSELAEILQLLPANASKESIGLRVVYLARVYLKRAWNEVRRPKIKPDLSKEMQRLKYAAEELIRSIAGLSDETVQYLRSSKRRLNTPGAPDPLRLKYVADAFLHEHRSLRRVPNPKPIERRGRKVAVLDREVEEVLTKIFREAFGKPSQARGFPAFRKAVLEPLRPWRASSVDEMSRRDLRRAPGRSTQLRRKSAKIDI